MFSLGDFFFNEEIGSVIVKERSEFIRSIKYKHNSPSINEDTWLTISEYLPLVDLVPMMTISPAFAELVTYNRRYLIFKRIIMDFPSFFAKESKMTFPSIIQLFFQRSPHEDPACDDLLFDFCFFLISKNLYKGGMFQYLPQRSLDYLGDGVYELLFKHGNITEFKKYAPPRLLRDRKFLLRAPSIYSLLPEDMKMERENWKYVFQRIPTEFLHAPEAVRANKEAFLLALNHLNLNFYYDYHFIECLPRDFTIDREIALEIFKKDPKLLRYISESNCTPECMLDIIQLLAFRTRVFVFDLLSKYLERFAIRMDPFHLLVEDPLPEIVTKPFPAIKEAKLKNETITILEIIEHVLTSSSFMLDSWYEDEKLTNKHLDFLSNMLRQKMTRKSARIILDGSLLDLSVDQTYAHDLIQSFVNEKQMVMNMMKVYPAGFAFLPKSLQQDSDVITLALSCLENFELVDKNEKNISTVIKKHFKKLKRKTDLSLKDLLKQVAFKYENEKGVTLNEKLFLRRSGDKLLLYLLNSFPEIKSGVNVEQVINVVGSRYTLSMKHASNLLEMFQVPQSKVFEILLRKYHLKYCYTSVELDVLNDQDMCTMLQSLIHRRHFKMFDNYLVKYIHKRIMASQEQEMLEYVAQANPKILKLFNSSEKNCTYNIEQMTRLVRVCPQAFRYLPKPTQKALSSSL